MKASTESLNFVTRQKQRPIMRKLIKLSSEKWVHYSQRGNTVKLRWIGNGIGETRRFDLANQSGKAELTQLLDGSQEYTLKEVAEITGRPATAVEAEAWETWAEIVELLKAPPEQLKQAAKQLSTEGRIVPQTEFRRFYETLKMLTPDAIHEVICNYFLGDDARIKKLLDMFDSSLSHFEQYENVAQDFHPERNEGQGVDWFPEHPEKKHEFAKQLTLRLGRARPTQYEVVIPYRPSIVFVALDYEVSFRRTTERAKFEDGKSGRSSGAGGVDLLLLSKIDGDWIPAIGEIKAKTDKNMFFALIQALTYAVELTTDNQLRRFERAYQNHFVAGKKISKCDILLIYESSSESPKLLREACDLAEKLLTMKDSTVAQCVRRIAFLSAELPNGNGVNFVCKQSYESPLT